jgi:hypothetical protein
MAFGRDRDKDLERRLRDERPRPGDELVRRLSAEIEPRQASRRSSVSRPVLIAAVTAVLALSLGVAGAVGSARGSVSSFGRSVYHLVQPSRGPVTPSSAATSSPVVTPDHQTGGGDPFFVGHRIVGFPPFGHQYGILIPICYQGHIIYVHLWELFYYFTHGATSARSCFRHR